jgi:hypothetical protein
LVEVVMVVQVTTVPLKEDQVYQVVLVGKDCTLTFQQQSRITARSLEVAVVGVVLVVAVSTVVEVEVVEVLDTQVVLVVLPAPMELQV